MVMVAAGLTESLICVIIIMRQLTTGRLEGDKKLCVFQKRQSVDFTDVMGEIYFVAVHMACGNITRNISSYILWSNLILLKASPGSRLKIIALLCK